MLKRILFFTIVLVGFASAKAQNGYMPTDMYARYRGLKADSSFHAPAGPTPRLSAKAYTGPGALYFSTTDSAGYDWTGYNFHRRAYARDTNSFLATKTFVLENSVGGLDGGNLGSGWRWYDPDQQALRTFVPGTALMFDTATAGELRAAVDTSLMSTRAWRQKGVDSLMTIIEANRVINRLLGANGSNSIDNGNHLQSWTWNSLNGNNGLNLSYSGTSVATNNTRLIQMTTAGSATADSLAVLYIANTTSGIKGKWGIFLDGGNMYVKDSIRFNLIHASPYIHSPATTQLVLNAGGASNQLILRNGTTSIENNVRMFQGMQYRYIDGSGNIKTYWMKPTTSSQLNLYDSSGGIIVSFKNFRRATSFGTDEQHASALVQFNSSTQGILPPRLTTTERDAISSPAPGLEIYNTSTNKPNFYNGSTWQEVGTGSSSATNNSNIGSGYRLLKPAGQEIKTLNAGYGIAIDSTTATDEITIKSTGPNYTVQTLTDGSTITWDVSQGVNSVVTLAGTGRTLSITNPTAGHYYTIRIIQDGAGSKTITTWPTNTKWPGGIGPTLTTTASRYDIVTFYYDGTNYYGTYQLDFQ